MMPGGTSGWPTAPRKIASNVAQFVDRAGRQRFAGSQIPLAAEVEVLQLVAKFFQPATAFRTLRASAVTSGPVPSPGMTAILIVAQRLLFMVESWRALKPVRKS